MPCYRCGRRQADPERGPSPWKRGVRADRQVLVCPDCQAGRDWAAEMDHCPSCGAPRLVRRLGEVECTACGHVRAADPAAAAVTGGSGAPPPGETAPGLAEDVERALARVLGAQRGAR